MSLDLVPFIGMLFTFAVPIFVIYVAVTIINLMKQKNEILMEIRDSLEKKN